MNSRDRAQVVYLQWLSVKHPDVYAKYARPSLKSNLNGLGWIAAVANAVMQVGSAVVQKKQTDKAFKLQSATIKAQDAAAAAERAQVFKLALLAENTKRAAAGLNPVDENGNVIQSQALPMPSSLQPFANVGAQISKWGPWILGGGVLLAAVFYIRR